jgi:hypothetical protein
MATLSADALGFFSARALVELANLLDGYLTDTRPVSELRTQWDLGL